MEMAVEMKLMATRSQPISHIKPNCSGKIQGVVYESAALAPTNSARSDQTDRIEIVHDRRLLRLHRRRLRRPVTPE
jgi:hypothetical protein